MLERGVVNKKMSKIDKNGKLGWTIGEVPILRCPAAESQVDSTEVQKYDVQTEGCDWYFITYEFE